MTFDPDKHHRRSIRLKGHDYSQPGAYFVTICTRDRACLLGEIVNGEMRLNPLGKMAAACWQAIPHHFPRVVLDEGIIMPNHIHGIIVIQGRGEASAVPLHVSKEQPKSDASPLQRCPNGTQLRAIREYILCNPARWNEYENNPAWLNSRR